MGIGSAEEIALAEVKATEQMKATKVQGHDTDPQPQLAEVETKCPVTGAVSKRPRVATDPIVWTEEGWQRLQLVPLIARPLARNTVERFARNHDIWRVTTRVMDENKQAMTEADELLAVNPAPLLILSGGEPLLRHDLTEIAGYASERGATVVVGTNGTLLTDERIAALKESGVRGIAVSIDSLRASYHDNFRHGKGSLDDTIAALGWLREQRLDFIIQTTATKGNRAELERLAQWAAEQGAVAFNCYFLVATGRGAGLSDLAPADYEAILADLARWQRQYRGQMMVRAKCAPHFMRHVHSADPHSPILNYETRCPCGTQYCRITPDGKLTPCPYLPEVAGDLRAQSFAEIWRSAPLFRRLREGQLGE